MWISNVPLTSGWLPVTSHLLAVTLTVLAVGPRPRRWWVRSIPIALVAGVAFAVTVRAFVKYQGWSEKAASVGTVCWVAFTGFAAALAILGWRGGAGWQRAGSVLAVALCALSAALALNAATGYFRTIGSAWQSTTDSPPAQWIDEAALAALVADGARPAGGTLVWVDIPADASGFAHRTELVYLPPAWFASDPPPQLPAVMMVGAEFSHPSDWLESGGALPTLDDFAARHPDRNPVVVFPDSTGNFSNDTECVNGPRGNAADHLTNDVVPFMTARFGVRPTGWGIVGWSSGGTCALTTAVMHPELFTAFVDLDGQLGPNAGTRSQTIARLFGGDADAWAAFDPKTVVTEHGGYDNLSAWVGVSEDIPTDHYPPGDTVTDPAAIADWDPYSEEHAANATKLCILLSGHGVDCTVSGYSGSHDFPSAGVGLTEAFPWLVDRLG